MSPPSGAFGRNVEGVGRGGFTGKSERQVKKALETVCLFLGTLCEGKVEWALLYRML
jgi:hypothetical protein